MLDIRWDDPSLLPQNTSFSVIGVNVYRAYNDRGPYQRLNLFPIGGTIWRDFTDNILVSNEIVNWETGWQSRGDSVAQVDPGRTDASEPTSPLDGFRGGRWTLRTQFEMVKQIGQAKPANSPLDVAVYVNGQPSLIHEVVGSEGLVTLQNTAQFDSLTETNIEPNLPTGPDDEVLVCYFTNKSLLKTDLDANPVYRVTTVALDPSTATGLTETPLNFVEPISLHNVDSLTYIWREAVRRNQWIMSQGGERVKLFVKKVVGERCPCFHNPRRREYYKQPKSMCEICYGTGFIGGYDGPFEVTIAPDDGPRNVTQTPVGRRLEHIYEVWCGPSPQITQRDFIVKQTNERYAIGGVRRVAEQGRPLQHHFNISYLDETNIIYKVPIFGTTELPWPQTRGAAPILQGGAWPVPPNPPGPYPDEPQKVHPLATEKENIPDSREERGRNRTSENITYAFLPFFWWVTDAISWII